MENQKSEEKTYVCFKYKTQHNIRQAIARDIKKDKIFNCFLNYFDKPDVRIKGLIFLKQRQKKSFD